MNLLGQYIRTSCVSSLLIFLCTAAIFGDQADRSATKDTCISFMYPTGQYCGAIQIRVGNDATDGTWIGFAVMGYSVRSSHHYPLCSGPFLTCLIKSL